MKSMPRRFGAFRGPSILILLMSFMFLSHIVLAANWVEISPRGYFYNSDYTFVDRQSGYVAVETTSRIDNPDGSYFYQLGAIDCNRWIIIAVAGREEGEGYTVFQNWRNRSDLQQGMRGGSYIGDVANMVCPNRNRLPSGALP